MSIKFQRSFSMDIYIHKYGETDSDDSSEGSTVSDRSPDTETNSVAVSTDKPN